MLKAILLWLVLSSLLFIFFLNWRVWLKRGLVAKASTAILQAVLSATVVLAVLYVIYVVF